MQVENRYAWFLGQSLQHGCASEHWTDCVVDSMRDHNAPVIMEALCRARYKFLARQKIVISKRWGFTNVTKDDYLKLKEEKNVSQYVLFGLHFCWAQFNVQPQPVQTNTHTRREPTLRSEDCGLMFQPIGEEGWSRIRGDPRRGRPMRCVTKLVDKTRFAVLCPLPPNSSTPSPAHPPLLLC